MSNSILGATRYVEVACSEWPNYYLGLVDRSLACPLRQDPAGDEWHRRDVWVRILMKLSTRVQLGIHWPFTRFEKLTLLEPATMHRRDSEVSTVVVC